MITIDELMTSDPFTLSENDSLDDARNIMTEKHFRHIPITNSDKHLLGLVTQRDVLEATVPRSGSNSNKEDIKLSDIMIQNVSVIHQSDSVRQAAIFLQAHKYGCLPVVSDDGLVGIITDSDFIDIAINLLEQVEIAEEVPDVETDMMEDVELPVLEEEL
ncbi:MAG: CBS domain-containing protein [Gammaproteobacteria bacterium]|jgi:CBS domain-containing protein|nr:CBS domain-containing protein [Gammaproteobacteria bacterium]MBT3723268.1 CBS domain-containing protein [Gammaproteobacteria bacterium]MBT4194770.1 CBS domain-containing protein [Gammaproteobacteria bacterium]MBT4452303.1 CBS domain-containing protein [Gammaproteobacteria bacterium]MBT4862980.1 CBS domain-containing protein [Gammaproteobacteria bacterium]